MFRYLTESRLQTFSASTRVIPRAKVVTPSDTWVCCADLFLPTGYPDTLTPDYLEYQLWALPVHVTGWLANSLATSSMLKAAGIGSSAAGAVAAGAAIKWITKDGIGALGRVLVGGGLARFFDEDPRFWRFWADVVKCFGQALEVATPLYPDMFILLAGAGNLTKVLVPGWQLLYLQKLHCLDQNVF